MAKQRRSGVSAETDDLSSTLLGDALDLLASGHDVNVLLAVGDACGTTAAYEFMDDGTEALLEGARKQIVSLVASGGDAESGITAPVRYALAYEGAVDVGESSFVNALFIEFGELGYRAYSAYCLYQGKGTGDSFTWTDPAPAGETKPLL